MEKFHTQTIVNIPIKDLVLWTENPRDPIDESATDQEVVERAYADPRGKWNLHKFVLTMGDFYDYSELPTVVYKNGKPVVYDGNRRIALAKIKLGYVNHLQTMDLEIPDFPETLPCAVCSEETAIQRILRKHSLTGSWDELEREKFERKYFPQTPKSPFLIVEETLGVISANEELNQNFVKKEIFTESNLKSLGFSVEDGMLHSKHSNDDNLKIFNNITEKIRNRDLSTRNSRGQVYDILDPDIKQLIKDDKNKPSHLIEPAEKFKPVLPSKSVPRFTKRTSPKNDETIFGEKLSLKAGSVNDLYRDIVELFLFWKNRQNSQSRLSNAFPALIRMSLRLLTETAAKDVDLKWEISDYISAYFEQAKKSLSKDQKTTLSNLIPGETQKIIQLLHTGAHNYHAACNMEQTMILSILVAKMLKISHGLGGK